ncbi:hypothetical protein [Saccharolobus islandicus]|uniref:DUF4350 domain-containing protein n=1 Tax=Saccharolobus islandicus (strain L.D.8.5 / Lassen \|nr:hypothetical protein [Sulfolobus islandicus]ADB86794.1 hypothetical protein LD85_1114 [Sulfolobus islandicus L.D.8.5]
MKLILLSSLLSILIVLTLIYVTPSTTPFSVFSNSPLGLSSTERYFTPSNNVVIIVQPQQNVTSLIKKVLTDNGTVVLVGDNSVINNTLKEFGAYIGSCIIRDNVFNAGNDSEIEVFYQGDLAVFFDSHPIYNVTPLVETSPYSYTINQKGPFTVVGMIKVHGMGRIIVISSPYVLTNYYIKENLNFLYAIIGKSAYIYPNVVSPLDYVKALLNQFSNYSYIVLLLSLVTFRLKFKRKNEESKTVLKRLLTLHPDWDENVLRRIYYDRGEE